MTAAVTAALARARRAAPGWAAQPIVARLRVIAGTRRRLAGDAVSLAGLVASSRPGGARPVAEVLVAEMLPLLDAARFLEREAAALLAPRRPRGMRPRWLRGVRAEIRREPCGVVLVLAPGNYPLFLPGVQILQALAAGNVVCAKPAPGCGAVLDALAGTLAAAGLPDGVLTVLADDVGTGIAASGAGFDRIVLTGSAETGQRVLAQAAPALTPCTMELSGCDAVFVLPGADLALVAEALAYGLRLNGGATCIAPRRVFVMAGQAAALETALRPLLAAIPPAPVPPAVLRRLAALLVEAAATGARVLGEAAASCPPIVIADAGPGLRLLREDVFAPVLALVPVADAAAAVAAAAACPYALGAVIFGPEPAARALAPRVAAGAVVINDLIVPTADPRLPFGGRHRSGFGLTRGAEGLLEMTVVKVVAVRRGRFRPHLAPPRPDDAERFAALLTLLHGPWRARLPALRRIAARPARGV